MQSPRARAWNPRALLTGGILLVCVGAAVAGLAVTRLLTGSGHSFVPPASPAAAASVRVVAQHTVTVEGGEVSVKRKAPLCGAPTQDGGTCRRPTWHPTGRCPQHRERVPKKDASELP